MRAGTCDITATQPGNEYYNPATPVTHTLLINPAPLTVTANDVTRLLGASTPAFSVTYAGFVNSETPAVLGGSLVFATDPPVVSATQPISYAIRPSGLSSTNYEITYIDGTLTTTYRVCLLYDPAKALTGGSIPIKLFLCDAKGKNLSASSIGLTALEVLRDVTTVKTITPPGSFTFSATLKKGGGYQYDLSTKGLTTGQKITYRLKFRVSTDVPGVYQYASFILK